MGEVYKMNIAGCERELPICPLNEHMDIAGFVMFSDVEITERAAQALLEKCPEHDDIVTAESKGIPLAYEMARICLLYTSPRYREAKDPWPAPGVKLGGTTGFSVPLGREKPSFFGGVP